MWLVCGEALATMKAGLKASLTSHSAWDEFNWMSRSVKWAWTKFTLFDNQLSDRGNVVQAVFVVSELIAKKLKPHLEEEFVRERPVSAAELLAADKVKLFQNVKFVSNISWGWRENLSWSSGIARVCMSWPSCWTLLSTHWAEPHTQRSPPAFQISAFKWNEFKGVASSTSKR